MTVMVDNETTTGTTVAGFTMPAGVFRELLSGALIGASKDATLPTICGVRVEWDTDGVTSVATDRYRMPIGFVPWDGSGNTPITLDGVGSMLLARHVVEQLVKVLPKTSSRDDYLHRVSVSRVGDTVIIRHESVGDGVTVREFPNLDGDFPKWRSLVPSDDVFDNSKGVGVIGCNPSFMADVNKLPHDKNTPVRWRFSVADRPFMADFPMSTNRVRWSYLLMPARLDV